MEKGRQSTPLFILSGIRTTRMKNKGSIMVVSNRSSPMRYTLPLYSFHKNCHIFLCVPTLHRSGTNVPICYPNFRYRMGSLCSWFHQSRRWFMVWYYLGLKKKIIMDLLICIGTILTGLISKIPIFTTLKLIPMTKIMTSQLTVLLDMQLPFRLTRTILSHLNLFKYQNVMFNPKILNTIFS